jgi:anti-anti-sigma factor
MSFFAKTDPDLPSEIQKVEERTGLRIIRLRGSLDSSTVPGISKFVQDLRSRPGFEFKNLLLDFEGVTHADTSAVARLVQTLFDYKKNNRRVALIHITGPLQNLLEVMKLDKLVCWYPSEAEAVQGLEGK